MKWKFFTNYLLTGIYTDCIDFFNGDTDSVIKTSVVKELTGPRFSNFDPDWLLTVVCRFCEPKKKKKKSGHGGSQWSMLLHGQASKFGLCGDRVPGRTRLSSAH